MRSCLLAVLFALAFAPGAFARLDGYVQGFRAVVLLPGGTAGPSYGLRAP